MVEEIEGYGGEVEDGEWNKIQNKRKTKNQSQNKNNKNKNHNQDVTGKEQKGLTSILRTGPNYQSKQQRGPITSQRSRGRGGRRGRGDMNQNTNQHARSTTI